MVPYSLAATTTFFMVPLPFKLHAMTKPKIFWGGPNKSLDFTENKPKFTPASCLHIKPHTQACLKHINGKAGQLDDVIAEPADHERLLSNGLVFQKNFTIRSFEIGIDFKVSIGALMNYLQDTGLNHLKRAGIVADDTFGSTFQMSVRDIIWVVYGLEIQVNHYPSWADVVQVETWIYKSGRNSFCREWHVRDFKTGKALIRASSLHVMMNKRTRKFAKLSEEVVKELMPYLMHSNPDNSKASRKLLQLDTNKADFARTGLTPGWMDMDTNQHVSHIKLVNYVLESVPYWVVESHEISEITLEYRKECNRGSLLQSFSNLISSSSKQLMDNGRIEFDHLLCLECGQEIVRGRTMWKPKLYRNNPKQGSSQSGWKPGSA